MNAHTETRLAEAAVHLSGHLPDSRRQNVKIPMDPRRSILSSGRSRTGDPTPPEARIEKTAARRFTRLLRGDRELGLDTGARALSRWPFRGRARRVPGRNRRWGWFRREFRRYFTCDTESVYEDQRDRLLLVRGSIRSRLFTRAYRLGARLRREDGTYWQVLSSEMAGVFGSFGGIGSIQQRSTPRWVQR